MSAVGFSDDDEDFGEQAADVECYFCDSNHLHIVMSDDGGNDIAGIALKLEDGIELVQDLMRQIEKMTGLVFLMAEPGDLEMEEDAIGETIGNA